MEVLLEFTTPPDTCGYLDDRDWSLEYNFVGEITAAEYGRRMVDGWRRFGHGLFRPVCAHCRECRSIRVDLARFRPDRSQRRCAKLNADSVTLVIGEPEATPEKIDLYDRYHTFQVVAKEWPDHGPKDIRSYFESFILNPFPTEEWCYYLGDRLVGVGYVDHLPVGLSAIYFFYEPDMRPRSLGTWNVLAMIDRARELGLPHLYLGYFVAGCPSLAYKARFAPNQIRDPSGAWVDFRP